MKYVLKGQRKNLKRGIIIGATIPIVVYVLFTFIVIGVSVDGVSESAIIGLADKLGSPALFVGAIFAILAMTTSFLSLGLILKEIYRDDYHMKSMLAWSLVIIIPIMIVLLNLTSFIQIISVVGAVMGGFDGIMFLWMHQNAKKMGKRKPEFEIRLIRPLRVLLYAVFVGGLIYQLLSVAGVIA